MKMVKCLFFVAVFLGCTSTGRVGLCFLWFFVQELPEAQPAVFLLYSWKIETLFPKLEYQKLQTMQL